MPIDAEALEARRAAYALSGARLAAGLARWLGLLLVALLIALTVRTLLIQPFRIPSGSMKPGLAAGDVILVDKRAYGWSRAVLPGAWWPRALPGEPATDWPAPLREVLPERLQPRPVARGDVIVFISPDGSGIDYVKRVAAVGGDVVAMERGRLRVNGVLLPCLPAGQRICHEDPAGLPGWRKGARWSVMATPDHQLASMPPVRVPAGHYFVLGDHRDFSADSRQSPAAGGIGLVPDRLVVGRARWILWPGAAEGARWSRIGRRVE